MKSLTMLLFWLTLSVASFFLVSCDSEINIVNVAPTLDNQSFSIVEDAETGTSVGTIIATDDDGDALTFTVLSGNTNSVFAVNTSSGEITVNDGGELNSNSTASYNLTIQVSDGKDNTSGNITINVTDAVVPNISPVISNQTFEIAENSSEGTIVGTIQATDADENPLTFSIISGNDAGTFGLETNTGELKVENSAALDFEINQSLALMIEVSDGTASDQAVVSINILDVALEEYQSAEEVLAGLAEGYTSFNNATEFANLFDAVYANSILAPTTDWDEVYNHTLTSSSDMVLRLWENAYDVIYVANNIELSSDNFFSDSELDELIGQARLLRAASYLHLVNWFGNVPLEVELPGENPAFSTQEEILTLVLSDLNEAQNLLPASWSGDDADNFTNDLAKALRSRVYALNQDFSPLLSTTSEIIDAGAYSLSTSTDTFFASNSEIIWGFDIEADGQFATEYPKGQHLPVARLTEIYLLQAFANVNIGNNSVALTMINTLRAREGQEPSSAFTTGELFMLIADLYQNELDFEGLDFASLKQFNLAISQLEIAPFRLILPIPQTVIENNSNALQNPGY